MFKKRLSGASLEWLFSMLLVFLLLTQCNYQVAVNLPWKKQTSGQSDDAVRFSTERYMVLMDSAQRQNIPVFIDFYTSWCGPCKVMDRETFQDAEVSALLNEHFVNLKVNAEYGEGMDLAKQFQVEAYPTLVFIDRTGEEADRFVGLLTAPLFLRKVKKVLR